MKQLLLSMLLLLAMGCQTPDADPPAAGPPNADTPTADAQNPYVSTKMWQWPSRSGEPRDVERDHAECVRETDVHTVARNRIGALWACMRDKGWHRMKGVGLNFGGKLPPRTQ